MTRTGLRPRALFSEAGRNIASGTTRAVTFTVLLTLIAAACCAVDLLSISSILHQQRTFREAGGDVQTVSAPGRISAERCLALGGSPQVEAVAALRAPDLTTPLAVLPATPPALIEAAGDVADILTSTPQSGPGLYLDVDLADTLAVTRGDSLALQTGSVDVAGVFSWPADGRSPLLSGATVSAVAPTGTFDQCWARIWPADNSLTTALLSAVVADTSDAAQAPIIAQLNGRLGPAENTATLLIDRSTRLLALGVLTVALLLGFISIRTRRVEIAANRASGAAPAETTLQLLLETAVWVGVAGLAAAAITLLTTHLLIDPGDATAVFLEQLRTLGLSSVAALTGAALGTATVRRTSLYRYAKDR